MYRILLVKAQRERYASLYQYLTVIGEGGVIQPAEFDTIEALDEQIEKMLNEDGFSKSDFIVVKPVDYSIEAKDYSDQEEELEEIEGE